MLCYRCGSYTPDGSGKCDVCGQSFSERRRTGRSPALAVTGPSKKVPPFAAGVVVGERYRIGRAVHQGTAGWVLRARDEEIDVDVAFKVIAANLLQTDADLATFTKAVEQAKKLHHPNLVRIYDIGRTEQLAYYTMPFLDGLSLQKIIRLRREKEEVFGIDETMPLIGQIAAGLDSLGKLTPHGALRPASVLVMPEALKVTGLPHMKGLPQKPFVALQTVDGVLEYLSPEARTAGKSTDARADVFSLAVICAEMLTGELFGRDADSWATAQQQLPRRLSSVLTRAMGHNPKARHDSCTELFQELADTTGFDASSVALPRQGLPRPRETELTPTLVGIQEFDSATEPGMIEIDLDETEPAASERRDTPVTPQEPVREPEPAPPTKRTTQPAEPSRRARTTKPVQPPPPRKRRPASQRRFSTAGTLLTLLVAVLLVGIAMFGVLWLRYPDTLRSLLDLGESQPATLVAGATGDDQPPPAGQQPDKADSEPTDDHPDATQDDGSSERKGKGRKGKGRKGAEQGKKGRGERHPSHDGAAPEDPPPTTDDPPVPVAPPPPPPLMVAVVDTPAVAECPGGMIEIDGGTFRMGSSGSDPMRGFGDLPLRTSSIRSYCIDIYEHPNQKGRMPTVGISWHQAKNQCEKRSKRLCTEAEWEYACKGPHNLRFPAGNKWAAGVCNAGSDGGHPTQVGAFSRCRSTFGTADMAGNVAEWTAGRWSSDIPDKVVKGGAADQAYYTARCAARANESAGVKRSNLGFRCCTDLK